MVEKLAKAALSAEQIGAILDVDHKTIERRFGSISKKGRQEAHGRLQHKLVSEALAGNTACLEPRPESTTETRARPATAVTPAETQPQSSELSSELAQGTTHELAITDPETAKAMLGNRSNSPVRRFSSRRRVPFHKRAPRSIKMLIEMWFRTFRTKRSS